MEAEKKLAELGLELSTPGAPPAGRANAVRTGNLLFVGGHGPSVPEGGTLNPGKLGREVTVEQGYQSAQRAMVNCLSAIKADLGDLDKVKRVVKLLCMVNSAPDFVDQPRVANGATDLLAKIYGDRGAHARSAVGMGGLPGGMCVEIEMIVEVAD